MSAAKRPKPGGNCVVVWRLRNCNRPRECWLDHRFQDCSTLKIKDLTEVFRTTAVSYSSITPPLAEISGFATLRPQMQEQAIVEWLDSN